MLEDFLKRKHAVLVRVKVQLKRPLKMVAGHRRNVRDNLSDTQGYGAVGGIVENMHQPVSLRE